MDEKLKNALEISNLMVTVNNSKRILKEQFNERIQHYHNGGKFVVTQELITFTKALVDMKQESAVLLDVDGEPVRIDDLNAFLSTILLVYMEASNFYINEFQKIIKHRSVKGVLGI